ncbi:MAG: LytTR family transcriptional regulator [Defluviitaleaceae bacterium]|nr:LytTR family transcriptional regulator [Defluviitaleaceae bacterium]
MKVDIKINPELTEITHVIHAPKMTPELMSLIEILEATVDKNDLLVGKKDDKFFVVEPEEVDIIRTEAGEVKLYTNKGEAYVITKPLHKIHEQLPNNFVRISKSTIVNINRVDHLSNSFSRTMHIVMKNGITDYISRSYLGDIKKRLGI